jgi:hypothetical protein
MHFLFQNRRGVSCFAEGPKVDYLRNGVRRCSITGVYGNVPSAAVAFAVLPSPVSSFRCEGGSRPARFSFAKTVLPLRLSAGIGR